MRRGRLVVRSLFGLLLGAGCLATLEALPAPSRRAPAAHIQVPHLACPIVIDGRLDEPCYQQAAHVTRFVVASRPRETPPPTEAWMFWNAEGIHVAFAAGDRDIRAKPPTSNESDVDEQDRVELFLWSGRRDDSYACVEIGARGAVHDYLAHFYRRFDSSWSPAGWKHAVAATQDGYRVEAVLPAAEFEKFGLEPRAGARWRLGLFRADFSTVSPARPPTWVTWVDAGTPQADFHVAEAFGEMVLR